MVIHTEHKHPISHFHGVPERIRTPPRNARGSLYNLEVRIPCALLKRFYEMVSFPDIGVPERIRTSGPQIRNLMLYPAELRGPRFHYSRALRKWTEHAAAIYPGWPS